MITIVYFLTNNAGVVCFLCLQAVLDFNLCASATTIDKYCAYWDSEAPRLGESRAPALSAKESSVPTAAASSSGYDAWVRAGQPAEPQPSAVREECFRSDDCNTVRSVLDAAYLTVHSALPPYSFSVPQPQDRSGSVDAGGEVVTTASVPAQVQDPSTAEHNADLNSAAADFFLQQILDSQLPVGTTEEEQPEEDEQTDAVESTTAQQPAQAAGATVVQSNAGAAKADPTAIGADACTNDGTNEEEGWVYSRLHGYKIKISQENSGAIYKKILNEMSTTGAEPSVQDESSSNTYQALTSTHIDKYTRPLSPPTYTDPQYSVWRGDVWAKSCQFRPLRALSPHDSTAVEQQPERVIFSDDLKSAMFRSDVVTTSSMYDAKMHQDLKQRLIIRCLQGLGVTLPHCECSHATVPCSLQVLMDSVTTVNSEEDVLFHGIMSSAGAIRTTTASTEASASHSASHGSSVDNLLHCTWMATSICTVQERLLRKHWVCSKFGFDSELSFIIRLVSDVVYQINDVVSLEFLSQLRRVLMHLLTVRLACDVSLKDSPSERSKVLEEWRGLCRSIIETSVVQSLEGDRSSAGAAGVLIPAVGDLSVWAEYLSAECMVGQQTEALKVR